jgi:thymidylate kinase
LLLALEGFSGTGKTTLAKELESRGWLRLAESAHVVQKEVPVADRADTYADYSLVGATMQYSFTISNLRRSRNIVAEGYLLSDLAYARIRYDLGKSDAFPALLSLAKKALSEEALRPDLYILLRAKDDTISRRQQEKEDREKNLSGAFREGYYKAIMDLHRRTGQENLEVIFTDSDKAETLEEILAALRRRKLAGT